MLPHGDTQTINQYASIKNHSENSPFFVKRGSHMGVQPEWPQGVIWEYET